MGGFAGGASESLCQWDKNAAHVQRFRGRSQDRVRLEVSRAGDVVHATPTTSSGTRQAPPARDPPPPPGARPAPPPRRRPAAQSQQTQSWRTAELEAVTRPVSACVPAPRPGQGPAQVCHPLPRSQRSAPRAPAVAPAARSLPAACRGPHTLSGHPWGPPAAARCPSCVHTRALDLHSPPPTSPLPCSRGPQASTTVATPCVRLRTESTRGPDGPALLTAPPGPTSPRWVPLQTRLRLLEGAGTLGARKERSEGAARRPVRWGPRLCARTRGWRQHELRDGGVRLVPGAAAWGAHRCGAQARGSGGYLPTLVGAGNAAGAPAWSFIHCTPCHLQHALEGSRACGPSPPTDLRAPRVARARRRPKFDSRGCC
jgi:hypothetical protein